MKTLYIFITALILAALLSGCGAINFIQNAKSVTPSDTIITEQRQVSGFSGVDMSTLGNVVITQGDSESLTIETSDNIMPLIQTSVQNGILKIEMEKNVTINSWNSKSVLTYTITLKDLNNLTVSGLSTVKMDSLSTGSLKLVMSGAGTMNLANVAAQDISMDVSGLGQIEVVGVTNSESVTISGAGEVKAGDLQCQTAMVDIPGLGTATLWVAEKLSGTISGGGTVRYYGSPTTDTKTTGLGSFEALGSK